MKVRNCSRVAGACVLAVTACFAMSCSEKFVPQVGPKKSERAPFTPIASLELEFRLNRGPTLVEFAQDFNCARCDQMVSTMRDLRNNYAKDVAIHRANYLSAGKKYQLGICPTYMFVLDGQIVGQLSGNQPYPILASKLNDLIAVHQRKVNNHPESLGTESKDETGINLN